MVKQERARPAPVEYVPPADDTRRLRLYVYGIVFSISVPGGVNIKAFIGFFPEFGNEATAMERVREIAADTMREEGIKDDPALQVMEIGPEYLREHMAILELSEGLVKT